LGRLAALVRTPQQERIAFLTRLAKLLEERARTMAA